ncbi:MAG: rod-binding protein [Candidatus Auribacterota bacterium]|jgi:flagellar protein FlgJ|nr:rod-binding protein [Candidatus Auribacterota bacterium]
MDIIPQLGSHVPYEDHKTRLLTQQAADVRRIAGDNSQKAKFQEVAKNFESLFVNLLLQQMRKTIPKSDLIDGGHGQEIWEDMFYEEISKQATQNNSLGISELLMKEFQRHITDTEPNNSSEGTYENQ